MFIAFKWLVGMVLVMWIAICSLDLYLKRQQENNRESILDFSKKPVEFKFKNLSNPYYAQLKTYKNSKKVINDKQNVALWHWAMFVAGAMVVSLYNRKKEIISYTKNKLNNIHVKAAMSKSKDYFKVTAIFLGAAAFKSAQDLRAIIKRYSHKFINIFAGSKRVKPSTNPTFSFVLLQKLKEMRDERKKLVQLLVAAIQENKNIRAQYQLENMAKIRLVQHIENTQKQVKENRTRYVSFQQLYLVTNQENMFLKSRIRRLSKEKEDAERNLMAVMKEIYRSQNNELKAYCSRFIVRTKNNLLNSDVKAEIKKFLSRSKGFATTSSIWQVSTPSKTENSGITTWTRCSSVITDIIEEDCMVPLVSNAPKLKGLPGECIWTVKDKDGIIEKLYEYDYESDFDNCDTIRRIREYSVYHDKDCLLDFASSRTIVHSGPTETSSVRNEYHNMDYHITTHRFLTDSNAFKAFMLSNKNIVSTKRSLTQSTIPL